MVKADATRRMVNNIGASSILGQKNYNTYYERIGKMMDTAQGTELRDYVRNEHTKVDTQVKAERMMKRAKRMK